MTPHPSWPMDWARQVAVTGASGFVGRHLVDRLQRDGLRVLALSRQLQTFGLAQNVCVHDYSDVELLTRTFAGVSVVFHLAARAHQRDGTDAAAAYTQANVSATEAVTKACMKAGVRRLVFVSSIGVNGNRSQGHPFTEADAPAPAEPYAHSKLAAERALAALLADSATDFVILRPPLVYGPGCPGNFRQLLKLAAQAPLVPLAGIKAPRRFIYVGNLVDALCVASVHPQVSRRTFLLGDARDVSVAEIAHTAVHALGRPPFIVVRWPQRGLKLLASLAGKAEAFDKLSAPLQVDPGAFQAATSWVAPYDPTEGLQNAARALLPFRQ